MNHTVWLESKGYQSLLVVGRGKGNKAYAALVSNLCLEKLTINSNLLGLPHVGPGRFARSTSQKEVKWDINFFFIHFSKPIWGFLASFPRRFCVCVGRGRKQWRAESNQEDKLPPWLQTLLPFPHNLTQVYSPKPYLFSMWLKDVPITISLESMI